MKPKPPFTRTATPPPMPAVAPPTEDERFMDAAILAGKGGRPSPEPHLGAVLVKNGELVASAFLERAGGEHPEVTVLRAAAGHAEGATLYVSLEPCNQPGHPSHGAPCIDAIVAAKVARLVIGTRDPNPHLEGGGLEKLRKAGIDVVLGVREEKARLLVAPWAKFVTTGLPYVSLKLALSLDGRIATRTGASKWVTGPEARAKVHLLRAKNDAITVGIGTALADDPRLTVRDAPGESPMRVVFDTKLRLPLDSRMVRSAREVPTMVLCGIDAPADAEAELADAGVECLRSPLSTEGRLEVFTALRSLAQRGVVTLMVEGGAELAGSFLAGQLADELHAFIAPILLGPRGRAGAVDWAGPNTPQQAPRIAVPSWELVGSDAYVHGQIMYPEAETEG